MDMEMVHALINESRGTARKGDFDRMASLLERLGHPEKDLRFVHIAGTNGKGSASVMVEAALRTAGYRTALFTSPHMEKLNERFRINNENISDEELVALTDEVWQEAQDIEEASGQQFYSFDLQTAMTFVHATRHGADVVILETGIGGLKDVTNVIKESALSIIMSIGYDHQGVLGDTIEEIAAQKAGIIKDNGRVVTYPEEPSIEAVYKEVAEEKGATWVRVDEEDIQIGPSTKNYQYFDYKDFKDMKTQLPGLHQAYNGSVVVEALVQLRDRGFPKLTDEVIRQGVAAGFIPGRMELVHEDPDVFLDGAHNMDGNETLKANLQTIYGDRNFHFIMGSLDDKDATHMIQNLEDIAESFLLIAPSSSRAIQPEDLQKAIQDPSIPVKIYQSVDQVVDHIKTEGQADDVYVVCGSLYLVGDMRIAMRNEA